MIIRTFTCKEHQEYGGLGWQPDWVENQAMVDPIGGMGVAHDILEHPLRGIGGAENEFMAFGSIYWIRGQNNWWRQNGNFLSVEDHMSSDYAQILPRIIEGYETLKSPGRTTRLDDDRAEEVFHNSIQMGFLTTIAEQDHLEEGIHDLIHDGGKDRVLGWLRKGYRMAQKRYKGIDSYDVACIFTNIMNDADKRLKHAEEGMKLKVWIDFDTRRVSADCYWPGEEIY